MIVEPSVQAAAGMQLADHAGLARLGAACRAHDVLLICDEIATGFGRTGTLFASEQCGPATRPAVPGQGPHRGLPPDVGDRRERPRVRRVPRRRPRRAHAVPRPLVRRERARGRGRAAPSRADRRVGRARERARALRRARAVCCTTGSRRSPRCARCGCAASWAAVELAPPADGLKWGRRVSAAAVDRGRAAALDRRQRHADAAAHDHVGGAAPHRARAERRDRRGRRRAAVTWDAWAESEAERDPRRGPLARAAHARRARPRRHAHRRRPRRRVVRVERLPRPHRAPGVIAAAHDALDRWGAGAARPGSSSGRGPCTPSSSTSSRSGRRCRAPRCSRPASPTNLGVITTFGGAGVLVCSDELNHASIIDGCRLARADVAVYRHRDLDHLAALLRDRGDAPRARGHRHRVLDGRRRRRPRPRSSTSARARARCSSSTRRTRCSARSSTLPPDARRAPHRHAVEDARRARRLRRRARRRYVELVENLARPYIFTTAPTPADTAAALAALRVVRSPEGAALVARLRAHVDRLRPGPPVADRAVRLRRRAARARRRRRAARRRPARSRDPAADGSAPARRDCASTVSAAHTDAQVDHARGARSTDDARHRRRAPVTIVAVAGTGTDVGKTYVTAALLAALRARGHRRSPPANPCSRSQPATPTTDADVLARRDRRGPARRVPARTAGSPLPMAPPMAAEALGLPPFTIADLAGEVRAEHRRRRARARRDRGRRALPHRRRRRLPPRSSTRSRPRSSSSSPTPGLGTINLVRLSRDALWQRALGRRVPQPVRRALTTCTRATRDWLRTREGLEVVTDIEALVELVERVDDAALAVQQARAATSVAVLPLRSVSGPTAVGVARRPCCT